LTLLIVSPFAIGMNNPARIYCEALNYTYIIEDNKDICILPDKKVDAWEFLQGKTGTEYSYCKVKGLDIKTVKNPDICMEFLLEECAVCILSNGTEIEVTKLMNLSFEETTCGDGICGLPENYKTCPQDCPSGSYDAYCDGILDGMCDWDCVDENHPEKDPDCPLCGNKNCEEGESYLTCPEDCEKPELCGNGICEADENYETCPQDCPKKVKCGDGICDKEETSENCCLDCGCLSGECVNNICKEKDKCGDRICSEGENYGNCAKDCSSGVADGYCDGAKDNICDPDCSRDEDEDCLCNKNGVCESEYEDYLNCAEDCEKPSHPIFLIAIPIIVIVVVLGYLIYSKSEKYEGGE